MKVPSPQTLYIKNMSFEICMKLSTMNTEQNYGHLHNRQGTTLNNKKYAKCQMSGSSKLNVFLLHVASDRWPNVWNCEHYWKWA